MSGTACHGSLNTILENCRDSMQGESWEMVDLGAGSGVVVAMSLTYGASLAVGIELKNEGQDKLFSAAMKQLETFGVEASRASIRYGVNIANCNVLPTLQTLNRPMRKVVFAFCDGFAEGDRFIMFGLIGRDARVSVFMCSCGKGKGDQFSTPESVLQALNASATLAGTRPFEPRSPVPILTVHMYQSHSQKSLHVFIRQA